MQAPPQIRPFEQARDAPAVIALIDTVYREFGDPGIDHDGYDRDLLQVDRAYREPGGQFIVATVGGQVVGTHATLPVDTELGLVTFRRLYLQAEHRGTGLADAVMQWALDWSREHGFRRVEFWSDLRFTRAHRFFARFGFASDGAVRQMEVGKFRFSEKRFTFTL